MELLFPRFSAVWKCRGSDLERARSDEETRQRRKCFYFYVITFNEFNLYHSIALEELYKISFEWNVNGWKTWP